MGKSALRSAAKKALADSIKRACLLPVGASDIVKAAYAGGRGSRDFLRRKTPGQKLAALAREEPEEDLLQLAGGCRNIAARGPAVGLQGAGYARKMAGKTAGLRCALNWRSSEISFS